MLTYLIQLFSKEHFYAVFFQDLIFSSFLKTCNVEKCFINQLYQKIMGEAVPQMLLSEQTQDENNAIFGLQMKVLVNRLKVILLCVLRQKSLISAVVYVATKDLLKRGAG